MRQPRVTKPTSVASPIIDFFTKTLKGQIITITSGIAIIVALYDSVVKITQIAEPLTCKGLSSLPWCESGPNETWSDEAGGTGGSAFSEIKCQDSEVLVGLFGRVGEEPFVFSIGPICAMAQIDWWHRVFSVSHEARKAEDIGGTKGDPFELKCPPDALAVGYDLDSAVVETNFGAHEFLVKPLKLRCSGIPTGNNNSWSAVAGTGVRQPNASHKPFACPTGSVAFGIKGRAGQFVDALSLGCRRL